MTERLFDSMLTHCGADKIIEAMMLSVSGAGLIFAIAMILLPNNPTIIEEKESN